MLPVRPTLSVEFLFDGSLDDPITVMGYCALAISSTSCIGPESKQCTFVTRQS